MPALSMDNRAVGQGLSGDITGDRRGHWSNGSPIDRPEAPIVTPGGGRVDRGEPVLPAQSTGPSIATALFQITRRRLQATTSAASTGVEAAT